MGKMVRSLPVSQENSPDEIPRDDRERAMGVGAIGGIGILSSGEHQPIRSQKRRRLDRSTTSKVRRGARKQQRRKGG